MRKLRKENIKLYEETLKLKREVDFLKCKIWKLENPPKYSVGDIINHFEISHIDVVADRCGMLISGYHLRYSGFDYLQGKKVFLSEEELDNRVKQQEYFKKHKINQ